MHEHQPPAPCLLFARQLSFDILDGGIPGVVRLCLLVFHARNRFIQCILHRLGIRTFIDRFHKLRRLRVNLSDRSIREIFILEVLDILRLKQGRSRREVAVFLECNKLLLRRKQPFDQIVCFLRIFGLLRNGQERAAPSFNLGRIKSDSSQVE